MDSRAEKLVAECRRQAESCLYTSTTFYLWLREARVRRAFFISAPIVLGAIATWSVLDQPDSMILKWVTATAAMLAGLFPALYEALKLDAHIGDISNQAAEFKNLQDRFRQAAEVASLGKFEDFETAFNLLMERLEAARSHSTTPPERFFLAAQKKIKSGDYSFGIDEPKAGPVAATG